MKPVLTVDVGGCFAFSPDSERSAVAKKSVGKKMGKVVEIDVVKGQAARPFAAGFSPNGEFLALSLDRTTVVYQVRDLV